MSTAPARAAACFLRSLALGLAALASLAAGAQDFTHSKLTVQGAAQVQVYVNGQYLGKSAGASRLALYARSLLPGDNVIALRASAAAAPFVVAELAGPFGRLGSGSLWRAAPAATAGSSLAWTQASYDDAAWAHALDEGATVPQGFPTGGPAHRMWLAAAPAGDVLLRARVYLPSAPADVPAGMGSGVSGGAGGEVVTVSTPQALQAALCNASSAGVCSDATPRIVQVASAIDFTASEGSTSRPGCYPQPLCPAPMANERLALLNGADTHCAGKTLFDVVFDKAGAEPLLVGSNKTLVGLGNDAALRGKGLFIGHGASNVVVRNLTIERINQGVVFAGDGITLDGADRVWIDHDRFDRIGRQMIVSGYGPASNVTISWNDFDGSDEISSYCNGRHYWNLLMLGEGDRITLADNWIRHFAGRAPHVGAGQGAMSLMHIAGNEFDDGSWHALDAYQPARVLMEGNAFDGVAVPILDSANAGFVWASLGVPTASHQQSCATWLGRPCVGNSAEPAPQPDNFRHDLTVLDYFQKFVPAAQRPAPFAADAVGRAIPFLAGPGHL